MASLILLIRNVPRAAAFYRDGLGLELVVCTQRWAELRAGDMRIALQQVDDR